ncbi:Proteasome activator complex subunit 4 [Rhizoctonia solani]|uniref:ubiquitinyl hydrolase 1 n=1 Tax=Rhizoctonia solani TaxID=456999 RepID=A0A0K6FY75_9AGAM|nr:Proteasome activator complex subunit 4 [Rhizoctonia solani]
MSAPSNSSVLQHLAYNVFLPPKLPQEEQKASFQQSVDLAIVGGVIQAGHFYQSQARIASQWAHIKLMLERLSSYIEVPLEKSSLREDMKNMKSGEVANILVQMDTELFADAQPTTRKAGTNVRESRNSINPNYFIQYFFGFLRGMGTTINPPRVVKRLADEVLWVNAKNPWRRSPIWLLTRVALQTSFDSTTTYKHFMVCYHAYVLSRCAKWGTFSSDLFYAMRVKMARRLHKIKDSAPQFLIDFAEDAANRIQNILQGRWDAIQSAQSQSQSPNQNFSGSNFQSAVNLTLPNSRQYLERVFQYQYAHKNPAKFSPSHPSRSDNIREFSHYANGGLSRAFTNDPHLALFDFEASVFEKLVEWTSNQQNFSAACVIMSSCFRQYLNSAKSYYIADAADQSIMILTLMRIWMAIDELAIKDCPLLSRFSPELPADILDPLLLRTTQHLEAACTIQQHIRRRYSNATQGNPSILSEKAAQNCFAVQYFRSSSRHQQRKAKIEAYAQEQQNRKIKELEDLNAKHEQLGREIDVLSHEYRFTPKGKRKHVRGCSRCTLEKTRSSLHIRPYEWPLPPGQLDAEMVVFELDRPESFIVWRDITYEILLDLGTLSPRTKSNKYTILDGYSALGSWRLIPASTTPRITIASSTKSFGQSHYNSTVSIPASRHQVCLDNALQFKLYDKNGDAWASGPFPSVTFSQYGTLKLPANSLYRHLGYAIEGTTHTSNQVLADQHDCPKELSLHEHIAFGTLRSGARLQWMNIVRGLEEDLLSFSADEVRLLHTQAAWQVGPLMDNGTREWHEELNSLEFGRLLVLQCKRVLDRVKANWLQAASVSTIVMLVTRLLASSPNHNTTQLAFDFLRSARAVTHKWLDQLKFKLKSATGEQDVVDYQRRVCEMAAICRATYDVGPHHMRYLLATPDDFTPFIISSICLFDNQPPNIDAAPVSLRMLLCRDRRFAHHVAPFVLQSLRLHDILSTPLSDIWPDYRPGSTGWRMLSAPNNRWITTTTAGQHGDRTQTVNLNILTGQLLIDGKPLGRLPRHYVEHPTYVRLFGQNILDVVPAKSPGMEFTTRDYLHGYQVSFAFEGASKRLIIQARKHDHLYELIPHETLARDFPSFFSEDYHHWADIRGKTVEFCPLSSPWSIGDWEWRLRFHQIRTLENLKHDSFLVDIHSTEFQSLARSLSPLESDQYLHATRSVTGLVEIELPRMKLSFFINQDSQLESRNFRDQVLDEDQSAGTLFGLKNQLLLRAKGTVAQSLPRSRTILIPDGEIHFSLQGHHVSVSIQFDSRRSVDVYRYKIDRDLGYLATDAGLTSRLFKIYLHALTSHCLPDPLTGRTGTEEALQELSQGSSSSFEQIDVKQAGLLKAIGLLTPKREYYPKHLKSMQTTQWIKLPSLSQHYRFSFAAASILRRADMLQLFYPLDFKIDDYINALDNSDLLLKRATRRTAIYYPSDTAGSISDILGSETGLDSVCPGRDNLSGDWMQGGQAARWASGLAYQNYGKPIFMPYQLASLAHSWGTLNDSEVHYPLTYQSSWFSLNLRSCWITFYNLLRRARVSDNKYMLSACLSSIAFGQGLPTDLIPVFLAFATNPDFHILNPPSHKHYTFGDGYEPSRKRVEGFVSSAAFSSDLSPARNLSQEEDESNPNFYGRKQAYHRTHSSSHQSQLVQHLMNQWSNVREGSSVQLRSPGSTYAQWIKVESCLKSTREYFTSCMWNLKMKNHLLQLESVLSSGATSPGTIFSSTYEKLIDPPVASSRLANPWRELSISSIMGSRLAPTLSDIVTLYRFSIPSAKGPANDTARLAKLFTELQENESALNRRYGIDLDASRRELDSKPSLALPGQVPQPLVFNQNRERCSTCHLKAFQRLESALSPSTNIERILSLSGIWPRITSRTLLQQLSLQNRRHRNLRGWWKGLTGYAHVFAGYQRSHRLIALAESGSVEELYKEMDVPGNNDPGINDPDWLLVQIDGNFSARTIQRQVAQEMISPSSGSNTVLQLNMGEGKSSVIVPIVASSLANSSRLVRVVVLKPLWRQMFELLVNRLSGLSNRRVYYLPFGRHINIDSANAIKLRNLYEECMREGGILLAQPEHILSFKLMGIDRLISSNEPGDIVVAKSLRNMQSWLNTHSRDILDESDEILHVRYQLVYTAGQQQPLDDHPDRWTTTQQFLRLTATHVKILQQEYPDSVSYKKKDGGQFPSLRIMPDCSTEVEKKLISAIAADVQNGRLPNLNCDSIHPSSRNVLFDFLVNDHLPYHQYELLRNNCDSAIWKGLLLIRGLLASGILVFTLKRKHYRVDYGLDLSRTLLAVPYRAKDLPSLRAEFGHPDVAVVLTCFSYYYQGLTEQQLNLCFELLLKLDNPPLEYEQWVQRDDTMPEDLRQLNGVNIKDRQQFTERLVPTFSHNSGTIDFFLFSVVFPKEAKEFPKKLATSGWDLAEGKADVTTGFSGTNDNRYLLPTSIKQADPVKQLSTNALVLTYLLQPENNTYVAMCDDSGESLTTEGFLKLLVAQTPEVRVLLDVGAQMLELQNEALVRRWLCLRPDIEAAVYFNDRDELVVLPQNGTPALLSTSPFSQRLDKCIVYLDDGHTRGTDLKLPRETRALVTLGPKVTKDRLLQGCMRMRKLGHGQSVMFAAPPEIDTQIRNASPDLVQRNTSITPGVGETQKYSTFLKNFWSLGGLLTFAGQNAQPTHRIDALDVLRWAMLQTCKDLQHHVSHWAQQGIEHAQRHEAERTFERTHNVSALQEGWITPESRSLEQMYGVLSPEVSRFRSSFTQRAFDVPALQQGLENLGVKQLEDPGMDEEQEREVNHEIEREQQTQRPPKGKPVNHSIHPDVKRFINTGTLCTSRSAFLPLFHPFRDFNSQISESWSRLLYCSVDFLQTVAGSPTDRLSEYLRPVNWIVSGHGDVRVVLSPHEVNELLPLIRNSSVVRLHIYASRVSLSMLSFSDLQFYSIPAPPTNLIRSE